MMPPMTASPWYIVASIWTVVAAERKADAPLRPKSVLSWCVTPSSYSPGGRPLKTYG